MKVISPSSIGEILGTTKILTEGSWIDEKGHMTYKNVLIHKFRMHRLDVGEGREVHHERCPRAKLQQQCIKYLGPVSLSSPFFISFKSVQLKSLAQKKEHGIKCQDFERFVRN